MDNPIQNSIKGQNVTNQHFGNGTQNQLEDVNIPGQNTGFEGFNYALLVLSCLEGLLEWGNFKYMPFHIFNSQIAKSDQESNAWSAVSQIDDAWKWNKDMKRQIYFTEL